MHCNHRVKIRTARCGDDPQVPVIGGLAMSATQVAQMVKDGVPVSTTNQDFMYFDGQLDKDAVLDPEFSRGYDINVAWEQEMTSREKISRGRKAAKLQKEIAAAQEQLNNV